MPRIPLNAAIAAHPAEPKRLFKRLMGAEESTVSPATVTVDPTSFHSATLPTSSTSNPLPSSHDAIGAGGYRYSTTNDGDGGVMDYYFALLGLLVIVIALVSWFVFRRRRKIRRDIAARAGSAIDLSMDHSRCGHCSVDSLSIRDACGVEGLDEMGEAPPPYKLKEEAEARAAAAASAAMQASILIPFGNTTTITSAAMSETERRRAEARAAARIVGSELSLPMSIYNSAAQPPEYEEVNESMIRSLPVTPACSQVSLLRPGTSASMTALLPPERAHTPRP